MAVELVDLPKSTIGKRNNPGMASKIWFLPIAELDEIPEPPVWAAPGDSLRIDGAITVVDPLTMGFREIYVTAKTAKLLMELVGQTDSKSIDLREEFFRPGFDEGFLEMILEDPDIIIAAKKPDCADDTLIIIGAPCNPAKIGEATYDSGLMGETDAMNGWSGVVTYSGIDIRLLDGATNPLPFLPTP